MEEVKVKSYTRVIKISPEERRRICINAAKARWAKYRK
jgi:hypothetical protein